MEVAEERIPDAQLGALIARGRDAEVFALGPDRVVRRTPTPRDLRGEARVTEHVRAAGYPAPEVLRVAPGEMVVERVAGPTMVDDLARRPWRAAAHGRTLADLHRRLHAIAAPPELPAHPHPGDAVLHGDLHPANVLLGPDGPVVIDWTNARRGDGTADVADVWLVIACLGADRPPTTVLDRVVARVEPAIRRRLLAAFLDGAGDEAAVRAALPATAALRLVDPNLRPEERTRVEALVAAEGR